MRKRRKIIDAHIHWWDIDNNYYPWLCDEKGALDGIYGNKALSKSYLPEHYLDDAQDYEVLGAVHIEAGWDNRNSVGETQWLQQLADSRALKDFPLAIVAQANFTHDNVEKIIEQHASYQNVRSIRQILNHMSDQPTYCWALEDYLKNNTWLSQFYLLEKYHLHFDLMCFSHQMADVASLADRHPNITIILEHCGMPTLFEGDTERWTQGIQQLALRDNIFCKAGGLGTMMPKWTLDSARPIFNTLFDSFGTKRMMFATNFPTDSVFCDFNYAVENFEILAQELSDSEQEDFFINNTRRVYNF